MSDTGSNDEHNEFDPECRVRLLGERENEFAQCPVCRPEKVDDDFCYSPNLLLGWALDHRPDDDGVCLDCDKKLTPEKAKYDRTCEHGHIGPHYERGHRCIGAAQ